MSDFNYPQNCRICYVGVEANYGRYKKRGYSTNTETCLRRCIRKIAKAYKEMIEEHPEWAMKGHEEEK